MSTTRSRSNAVSSAAPSIRRNAGIPFAIGGPADVQAGSVHSKAPASTGLEPVPPSAFAPRHNAAIPFNIAPIIVPERSAQSPAAPPPPSSSSLLRQSPSQGNDASAPTNPPQPPRRNAGIPFSIAATTMTTTINVPDAQAHSKPAPPPSHLWPSPLQSNDASSIFRQSLPRDNEANWHYMTWYLAYKISIWGRGTGGMEWLTTEEYLMGEIVMDPREG